MAKRKGATKSGSRKSGRKTAGARKSGSRPKARKTAPKAKRRAARATSAARARTRTATRGRTAAVKGSRKAARPRSTTKPYGPPPAPGQGTKTKGSRIDRERRRLEETVQTPPSSLDMKRRGSSARTGRREMAENLEEHVGMTAVTGGDVDADFETAYFSGDETPGGDNPTPDQDIVDNIGKSVGVEYQDNEELKAADKVTERDKHRWELDPASSEDYKDRD